MSKNTNSENFEHVLQSFLTRRAFLTSSIALGASVTMTACTQSEPSGKDSSVVSNNVSKVVPGPTSLSFNEVPHGIDKILTVADAHTAQVLIRWGDPIFEGVAAFNPQQQTAASQMQRFGFNNDFIGFVSLPIDSNNSDHGLLIVNHEYTSSASMFPGAPKESEVSREQADIDIAAHGLSVIEIKKYNNQWRVEKASPYNRRITPETPMRMAGPASGSERLKTIISQDGVHTLGTYGNCAGGVTPWGTILTGEENVDGFFSGDHTQTKEVENYTRFGVGGRYKRWGDYYDRWNLNKNPNGLLHMGWVVEIDPYNPDSKPKKRTALGHCKHEGCNVYINSDNHVVAYTGDDARFEYIYKFISKNKYDPNNRDANLDLLDEGVLSVARFNDDGTLQWLPLVYGVGPLHEVNGFYSQADVCIDSRKAADLVGATPMDRPEDVEVNPVNGRVYAMLTNNSKRKPDQTNTANPRAHNGHGQIIEFWPENKNHRSDIFKWDLFLLAGKPGTVETKYHSNITENGWLSCPDNCAFDQLGNLWIGTDGAEREGVADGVWVCEVNGEHKALTKRFLRTPIGAELCGPFFTPDDKNLFVSIQHPGGRSHYNNPSTRWPDFDESMPPRPSVVVITKDDGGRVGS